MFDHILQVLFPTAIPVWQAMGLIILSFFTSFLSASIGVGGGKAMLGVMAGVIPVNVLIAVHAMVQVGSNAGRTFAQRHHVQWQLVGRYFIGAVVGVTVGGLLYVNVPERALFGIIGLYILWTVWAPRSESISLSRFGIPVVGFITAFLSTVLGTTVAMINATLRGLGLERHQIIGTQAACVLMQHIMKTIAFLLLGVAVREWLGMIVLMILVGFLGTWAGTKLLNVISEKWFDVILKATLTLVALNMLRQALF